MTFRHLAGAAALVVVLTSCTSANAADLTDELEPSPSLALVKNPAPSQSGTIDDPVPLGYTADLGNFQITIHSWLPDMTEDILAFSEANEPPPDGFRYDLVLATFTYTGSRMGHVFDNHRWGIVETDGTVLDRPAGCSQHPWAAGSTSLGTGSGTTGYMCVLVDSAERDDPVSYIRGAHTTKHFALK